MLQYQADQSIRKPGPCKKTRSLELPPRQWVYEGHKIPDTTARGKQLQAFPHGQTPLVYGVSHAEINSQALSFASVIQPAKHPSPKALIMDPPRNSQSPDWPTPPRQSLMWCPIGRKVWFGRHVVVCADIYPRAYTCCPYRAGVHIAGKRRAFFFSPFLFPWHPLKVCDVPS